LFDCDHLDYAGRLDWGLMILIRSDYDCHLEGSMGVERWGLGQFNGEEAIIVGLDIEVARRASDRSAGALGGGLPARRDGLCYTKRRIMQRMRSRGMTGRGCFLLSVYQIAVVQERQHGVDYIKARP